MVMLRGIFVMMVTDMLTVQSYISKRKEEMDV